MILIGLYPYSILQTPAFHTCDSDYLSELVNNIDIPGGDFEHPFQICTFPKDSVIVQAGEAESDMRILIQGRYLLLFSDYCIPYPPVGFDNYLSLFQETGQMRRRRMTENVGCCNLNVTILITMQVI